MLLDFERKNFDKYINKTASASRAGLNDLEEITSAACTIFFVKEKSLKETLHKVFFSVEDFPIVEVDLNAANYEDSKSLILQKLNSTEFNATPKIIILRDKSDEKAPPTQFSIYDLYLSNELEAAGFSTKLTAYKKTIEEILSGGGLGKILAITRELF